MKSKAKKILLISGLVIIIVLIILLSTVFTFQKFEMQFITSPIIYDTTEEQNKILSEIKKCQNTSVLVFKKDKLIKSVEQLNPYLKINSLEIRFPNKLIAYLSEREQLYSVLYNQKYIYLDNEMHVLEKSDTSIGVNILKAEISGAEEGKEIEIKNIDIYKNAFSALSYATYTPFKMKNQFSSMIVKTTNFDGTQRFNLELQTKTGLKLVIENVNNNFNEKMLKGIELYETYIIKGESGKLSTGEIIVSDSLNQSAAYYS